MSRKKLALAHYFHNIVGFRYCVSASGVFENRADPLGRRLHLAGQCPPTHSMTIPRLADPTRVNQLGEDFFSRSLPSLNGTLIWFVIRPCPLGACLPVGGQGTWTRASDNAVSF
jgi:hypothetical protein